MVLDLGAGGGFDCFLTARQVGPRGRVIGVDMTPEMVAKARENARKGGFRNVEFRFGEIEHLPVADSSVDVKEASKEFIKDWFPGSGVERYVRSADVQGVKPVRGVR